MRRPALVLVLVLWAAAPAAAARRVNDLLHVVTPSTTAPAPAHPFVNVIVGFGQSGNAVADPNTFRARLGRIDITGLFRPILDKGKIVGMRGEAGPALIHPGERRLNRLRIEVRSRRQRGHGRMRDVDRVRFAAIETENQPPVAHLVAGADVVLPGLPLRFDGRQSSDPELDELTYDWSFGDGGDA